MLDSLGASEGLMSRSAAKAGDEKIAAGPLRGERPGARSSPRTAARSRRGTDEVGMVAVGGRIPLGYYKDPEKTAQTFRTRRRRALLDPRRLRDRRRRRHDPPARTRLGHREHRRREGVPGRGRARRCARTRRSFDCVVVGVPDERFGETVVALVQVTDGYYTDEVELQGVLQEPRPRRATRCPRADPVHRHAATRPERQGRLQAAARDGRRPTRASPETEWPTTS